jgi:hypothetical protein
MLKSKKYSKLNSKKESVVQAEEHQSFINLEFHWRLSIKKTNDINLLQLTIIVEAL